MWNANGAVVRKEVVVVVVCGVVCIWNLRLRRCVVHNRGASFLTDRARVELVGRLLVFESKSLVLVRGVDGCLEGLPRRVVSRVTVARRWPVGRGIHLSYFKKLI